MHDRSSPLQNLLLGIEAELQEVTAQIESFALSATDRESQQAKLNKLLERSECLKLNREHNLSATMPQYTHQFSWLPDRTPTPFPRHVENKPESDTQPSTIDETDSETSDDSFPDENYFCNRAKFENTSYVVHCMASDGTNIMYTTQKEGSQCARVAYCYLDTADYRCGKADPSREWLQSPIVDIVYWTSIGTFVCATEIGLRKVDHDEGRFRILSMVDSRWADPRIAVNTDFLWVHTGRHVHVYNEAFQALRTVVFFLPQSLTRTSFCLTDDYAAVAFHRLTVNGRKVAEVCFYNCDLGRLKTLRLGETDTPPMIRSDGNDRFFVATGQQQFLIVSPDGNKQTVTLGKQASCLTVVNSRNVVLTRSRDDVECVRCWFNRHFDLHCK